RRDFHRSTDTTKCEQDSRWHQYHRRYHTKNVGENQRCIHTPIIPCLLCLRYPPFVAIITWIVCHGLEGKTMSLRWWKRTKRSADTATPDVVVREDGELAEDISEVYQTDDRNVFTETDD